MRKRERDRLAKSMTKAERAGARSVEEREAASKLASMLGRRRALLAGSEEMARLGKMGSRKYWDRLTPAERSIEIRRRAAMRKSNQRKRLQKLLERTT